MRTLHEVASEERRGAEPFVSDLMRALGMAVRRTEEVSERLVLR
jgi:hypothetical protein